MLVSKVLGLLGLSANYSEIYGGLDFMSSLMEDVKYFIKLTKTSLQKCISNNLKQCNDIENKSQVKTIRV